MSTDLIGQPVVTRCGRISGRIVGTSAESPGFYTVEFNNGLTGSVRADLAHAALARGEVPVAAVAMNSLSAAVREARTALDDIRAGRPVAPPPPVVKPAAAKPVAGKTVAEIIAAQQVASPDKAEVIASVVAAHRAGGDFKAQVKRGIENEVAPQGGSKVVVLQKHCGRRD